MCAWFWDFASLKKQIKNIRLENLELPTLACRGHRVMINPKISFYCHLSFYDKGRGGSFGVRCLWSGRSPGGQIWTGGGWALVTDYWALSPTRLKFRSRRSSSDPMPEIPSRSWKTKIIFTEKYPGWFLNDISKTCHVRIIWSSHI